MCRSTGHGHNHVKIALNSPGDICSIITKTAAYNEHADPHANGTIYEQGATASIINEEEGTSGKDDEESVLDAGRDEIDVAVQVSHLEYVDNVVSHYLMGG